MWIIFIFGLFHGFGFAEELAKLNFAGQYTLPLLFGFNLGVEIGQVLIIAIVFPILYFLRKPIFYRRYFIKAGAVLLGITSAYWFIERAFDINIPIKALLGA